MCGIVGLVHAERERPVHEAFIRRMCDAIRHRGPNDDGIYIAGPVGLGMRRLSVIDLAGGHQPMFNEDASVAIVFNGEIYNYRELRAGLLARGHVMRTHSDTETIVHLYEELGERCVDRLRGMFAFAIWDSKKKRLFLARDRFGIKPLYFVQAAWGIAFASELKALHAVGLTDGGLDWEALEGVFRVGYIPAPRTPFKSVSKLEPGHRLTWEIEGSPRIQRYWDVPTTPSRPLDKVVEVVRDKLDESVKAHLESDVPLAVFLSSGLDSSAVISSMMLAGREVHAYTVRYRGSGADHADESPLARELAARYGFRLTVVDIEPDIKSILEPILHALDEPHGNDSALTTWSICRRVVQDYRVALLGTGGDELFAGYRRHFALAAARLWQRLPSAVRSAASVAGDRIAEPQDGRLGVARLKRFLRASGDSLGASYLGLQDKLGTVSLFEPDIREQVELRYTRRTFDRHGVVAPTDGLIRPALYLDYKTYLPDDLLHVADRMSMAHSLELRMPFVDHELVENFFTLPDHVRVGLMRPKRLLRRALTPRLPVAHLAAPKRGFIGPTAIWLRDDLKDVLADELSSARLDRLGFFDTQVVDRLRREHTQHHQNHEGLLWALLCFSKWHRGWVESGPAQGIASLPRIGALR